MIELLLPVLLIMALGWLARQADALPKGVDRALNDYVYHIAMPALMLSKLAGTRLGEAHLQLILLNALPMAAFMGLALAAWKAGFVKARMAGALMVCGVFGNIGFLGFPVVERLMGADALAEAAIVLLAYNLFLFGAAFVALAWMTGKGDWKFVRDKLASNTIIHSCIVGIILSLSGLALPGPLADVAGALGGTTTPVALFAMGAFLHGRALKSDPKGLAAMGLAKMAVFPLLFLGAAWLMPLRGVALEVSFVEALMPIGVLNLTVAQKFGLDDKLVADAIVATTLAFVPLLALWGTLKGLLPA